MTRERVTDMTAVVSRERARTTGLTAAAGALMLAVAAVMMIVAAPGHGTVRAHLAECEGCLEEYDVDVVVKTIVKRGCQEAAPDSLRLRIHEQLTVMRVTLD